MTAAQAQAAIVRPASAAQVVEPSAEESAAGEVAIAVVAIGAVAEVEVAAVDSRTSRTNPAPRHLKAHPLRPLAAAPRSELT